MCFFGKIQSVLSVFEERFFLTEYKNRAIINLVLFSNLNRKDKHMKPQTQILMIALAIAFTVAITLTVTLICMNRSDSATDPSTDAATTPNQPPSSGLTQKTTEASTPAMVLTTAAPTTEATTTKPEPILPDVSNGLAFQSLGNGTCRVESIGTCLDACVVIPEYSPYGDTVVEIAEGAFFSCATITAIQIPSTVKSIGDLAFAACRNLVYISVSDKNEFFCDIDGILYSADESTLICYPPMRAGEEMTVRACTTVIKEMAFYGCFYLKTVHYTGTAEQWESVLVGARNHSLLSASMTFSSDVGK